MQAVGKRKRFPLPARDRFEELKTLQMTAELTPETLRSAMEYRGLLPGFVSEAPDIKACYTERTENIGNGYGIYAKPYVLPWRECRDRAGQQPGQDGAFRTLWITPASARSSSITQRRCLRVNPQRTFCWTGDAGVRQIAPWAGKLPPSRCVARGLAYHRGAQGSVTVDPENSR